MKKNKIKFKYELRDMFEEYFWIVGLSLIVGGLFLMFKNPIILIGAGIIIACIGAYLKGGRRLK